MHSPRGFIALFLIQSRLDFNPARSKKGSGSSSHVLGANLSHVLAQRDSRERGKAQGRGGEGPDTAGQGNGQALGFS